MTLIDDEPNSSDKSDSCGNEDNRNCLAFTSIGRVIQIRIVKRLRMKFVVRVSRKNQR